MQSFETGKGLDFLEVLSKGAMWFDECLLKNVNLACCVQNRPGGYKCSGHMDEQLSHAGQEADEGLGWHDSWCWEEENRYLDLRSLVKSWLGDGSSHRVDKRKAQGRLPGFPDLSTGKTVAITKGVETCI